MNPSLPKQKGKVSCGSVTTKAIGTKDNSIGELLDKITFHLTSYTHRVESIESFVYMHCVGIQLERHFSKNRAVALESESTRKGNLDLSDKIIRVCHSRPDFTFRSLLHIVTICSFMVGPYSLSLVLFAHPAPKNTSVVTGMTGFEKKTDITTAINLAAKKRLPLLVQELEAKLETVAPNASHTTVKQSKETHLRSKAIKTELSELAMRRFLRARETSMNRLVAILTEWSRCE